MLQNSSLEVIFSATGRKKEDLTGLKKGYFLSTKVQHEILSINCGEDCTQHFRGAYFRLLLV